LAFWQTNAGTKKSPKRDEVNKHEDIWTFNEETKTKEEPPQQEESKPTSKNQI